MLRHIVLFKCNLELPPAEIANVFAALAALQNTVPGIVEFEFGPNNSPQGMNRGYTHAFTMGFTDKQARDAFFLNPEHGKVRALIRPILQEAPDSKLVVDFSI